MLANIGTAGSKSMWFCKDPRFSRIGFKLEEHAARHASIYFELAIPGASNNPKTNPWIIR